MKLDKNEVKCHGCKGIDCKYYKSYNTKSGGIRKLYRCYKCGEIFSETRNTVTEGLKTQLSVIITVINAISEGVGINAAARIFRTGKNSICRWNERFSELKETLFIYSLCNVYLKSIIEGDELYTKIRKNVRPEDSEGRCIVLTDRMSRFIWMPECGRKDRKLFRKAMRTLVKVIKQCGDVTLPTDGERRYGKILFEICRELLKAGKRGRPRKVLKKGVKHKIKNKGSRRGRGRKRPKYQTPRSEHPATVQDIQDADIHANHVGGFNAALRGICSAFRRRTNTYAKDGERLQHRLDVIWILRNFVQTHCTAGQIPAVAMGLIQAAVPIENLMRLQLVA